MKTRRIQQPLNLLGSFISVITETFTPFLGVLCACGILKGILAVGFAAWFEKLYKKYIPDTIRLFAVPFITTIVTLSLTFWIIGPAAISAVAGVTEPAIYGITLPKKSTFVRTCVVAGIGVFGYTVFINPMTSNTGKVIYSIIISVACLVAAFVLEMIFFRESAQPESEVIFSPMNGHGQS